MQRAQDIAVRSKLEKTKTIVIIDGEPELVQLWSRVFSELEASFSVLSSLQNITEALDYVAKLPSGQEPDSITIDCRMATMNGLEAAKILRARKPLLKIILVSAFDVPIQILEYFDAIIKNPYSAKKLLDSILTTKLWDGIDQ